jgi:predicted metal-dependent peptidase
MRKDINVMTKARTELVMSDPFFGSLCLRLRVVEDTTQPTAWINGVTIGYNPDFVKKLTAEERKGLLVHELLHPALLHHTRRNGRNPKRWNMACDYALNQLIDPKRYKLPAGALLDPQYAGMSADQIYTLLPKGDGPGGDGDDDDDGDIYGAGGWGEVRDMPNDGTQSQEAVQKRAESEWKQALAQAATAARQAGKLPAGIESLIDKILEPVVNWKNVLRRFATYKAPTTDSWAKVNRRFIGMGIYLPSPAGEKMGPMVVARDTSGSIYCDPDCNAQFMAEIVSIFRELSPPKLYVVDIDAEVAAVHEFEPGDDVEAPLMELKGGGGTDFRPLWDWISENDIDPHCIVYLTDGYGTFPPDHVADEFPLLWAMSTDVVAPNGETVKLDLY